MTSNLRDSIRVGDRVQVRDSEHVPPEMRLRRGTVTRVQEYMARVMFDSEFELQGRDVRVFHVFYRDLTWE